MTYNPCVSCRDPDARLRTVKDGLDPEWLCASCLESLRDRLAAWMVEHDRLVAKGMPERDVEKHIATLIARGARPPPVGRA